MVNCVVNNGQIGFPVNMKVQTFAYILDKKNKVLQSYLLFRVAPAS